MYTTSYYFVKTYVNLCVDHRSARHNCRTSQQTLQCKAHMKQTYLRVVKNVSHDRSLEAPSFKQQIVVNKYMNLHTFHD